MKIACRECGVYFTIDQQDAAEHTGLCDRCLNTLPVSAKFEGDAEVSVERKAETKAEKKARQKAELEEAKLAEEAKVTGGDTPPETEGYVPGVLATPGEGFVPSEDQGVKTGEGAPVETVSENVSPTLPISE